MALDEASHHAINEYAKQVAREYLDIVQDFNNEECTKITNEISHKVCQFI